MAYPNGTAEREIQLESKTESNSKADAPSISGQPVQHKQKELLTFGFVREYWLKMQKAMPLMPSHDILKLISRFIRDYESFETEDDEMNITNKNGIINITKIEGESSWSKAMGTNIIYLKEDKTFQWIFKINKVHSNHLLIGINNNDKVFFMNDRYYFQSNGTVTSKHVTRNYGEQFVSGDIMKIELYLFDQTKSYMKFYRNDKDLGKIFENEIDEYMQYRFYISMYSDECDISLLSFSITK
eukprot:146530_1